MHTSLRRLLMRAAGQPVDRRRRFQPGCARNSIRPVSVSEPMTGTQRFAVADAAGSRENVMRVAINLLYMIPGVVGGTETYARGLVSALASLDSQNEYLLFVNREARDVEWPRQPNITAIVCPVNATSRAERYAWEQL